MIKLKVGDNVKVTAGKDKGRNGKIEKIYPKNGQILIPEVNLYKKHVKSTKDQKGGIYDIPRPLAFSKVALICPKCKKVTRVGIRPLDTGKVRICRKCGREIDAKTKKTGKK